MLRDAWRRFHDLVVRLEELPWGPGRTFALLAGIVAVRNLLEITVARNPVFEALAAFVHYPLAYLAPAIALVLVLAALSGVAPARVMRLMALAWLLTLTPPLLDLLLHPGREVPTIAYLQADPSELGWVWLHFFDPRVSLPGTTPGIRLEALAAVLLGALYVALRSRRWWRALVTVPAIYATSLFFFSLPVIVYGLFRSFDRTINLAAFQRGEGILFRPSPETAADSMAIAWLVPLLVLLGFLFRRLERGHADRWLAVGNSAPADGDIAATPLAWVLGGTALAGILAARWLWLPLGPLTSRSPWDTLGTISLALGLVLLLAAIAAWRRETPVTGTALFLGGIALLAALGRSPAVGVLAAVGASVPLLAGHGCRLKAPAGLLLDVAAGSLASLGAFAAGFALLIGPEALARLPRSLAAAALAWGAVAVPVAIAGHRFAPRRLLRPMVPAVVGLAAVLLATGLLASPSVRTPLRERTRKVARLPRLRAEEHLRRGRLDLASRGFRRALSCDPDDVPSLRQLGIVRAREGNLEKARYFLRRAVELAPEDASNLANLAAVEMELGHLDEAIRLARQAVERAPWDVVALFNLAEALDRAGRTEEAIAAWQRYLALAEPRPEEAESIRHAHRRIKTLGQQHVRAPEPPRTRWAE